SSLLADEFYGIFTTRFEHCGARTLRHGRPCTDTVEPGGSAAGRSVDDRAGGAGGGADGTNGNLRHNDGPADVQAVCEGVAEDGGQLHRIGDRHKGMDGSCDATEGDGQAVLRWHDVSSRDSAVHDPGWRPAGDRGGRCGLLL